MERLKKRWGLTSNFQVLLIFMVFSINGSFATLIAKPLMKFIGLAHETTNLYIFWPLRILLIFIVYQTTLPLVGFLFGQFNFFWNFEKKMLRRFGLGRFLKNETPTDVAKYKDDTLSK